MSFVSHNELLREETALVSGEYLLQKKQSDTVGQTDEELMRSLGFLENDSIQATSPIVIVDDVASIDNDDERTPEVSNRTTANMQDNSGQTNANSGNDTSAQENEPQSRRNSSRRSLRQSSPRVTREQERFQGLLQELPTPAKGRKPKMMMMSRRMVMDLYHKA